MVARRQLARQPLLQQLAGQKLPDSFAPVITPMGEYDAPLLGTKRQWKQHGLVRFAFLYTWFHFRYGYWRNPFEVEARSEEARHSVQ